LGSGGINPPTAIKGASQIKSFEKRGAEELSNGKGPDGVLVG